MNKYDLIVIGSGPGGYVAAIKASQLGMKTAIVEKYNSLGGTCLNVGCIPSKALLDSSEHYHKATTDFKEHGIIVDSVKTDMNQMIDRKESVVDANVKGIQFLMKKNKVDVYHATASFKDEHVIALDGKDVPDAIEGKNIIIATGSKPNIPAAFNYDKKRVISSTEALNIREVPKSMVVIGGGVIGLELGSVFARLGTEVTVVEYMNSIISTMDADCSKELQRSLKKLGIKFYLGHEVTKVTGQKTQAKVEIKKRGSDEAIELKTDYCLVAIGRVAYTDKLGLENAGLVTDERGKIPVNENLQTAKSHIYAIGDVVAGAMLAHKAEDEGVFAVEHMLGGSPKIDYNLIPSVVYTWPEVASVGQTEQQLKDAGIEYKKGKFPFMALGRARASMDLDGMVKILADKTTDEILGVHIVGARAADMIAEAVVAMEYKASAEDIAMISHAHPTFTEAIKEAAMAAFNSQPIHM